MNGLSASAVAFSRLWGIAAAYGVIIVSSFKLHLHQNSDTSFSKAFQPIAVLLLFCMLMHGSDFLAFSWTPPGLLSGLVLMAVLLAAAVVFKLPRLIQTFKVLNEIYWAGAAVNNPPAKPRAMASISEPEASRHHELLKTRVAAMEDALKRNSWIRQSREAMQHLNDLLTEPSAGHDANGGEPT